MSPHGEPEAALRHALRAAAESIEPGADGLDRIKARLRPPRPLPIAWAEAIWSRLAMRMPEAIQSACLAMSQALRQAWDRFAPPPRSEGDRAGNRSRSLGWLRPLAAMVVAIFIVAAGAYAAIEVPAVISTTGGTPSQHAHGNKGHSGGTNSHGGTASTRSGGLGQTPPASTHKISGSPCNKTLQPSSSSSSSASSPSSSTSPSPTTSASGSPTPTPSSSASSSPNPSTTTSAASDADAGDPSAAPSSSSAAAADAAGASSAGVKSATSTVKQTGQAPSARSSCSPSSTKPPKRKKKSSATSNPDPDAVGAARLTAILREPAAARARLS
jgi:hypothetical protein